MNRNFTAKSRIGDQKQKHLTVVITYSKHSQWKDLAIPSAGLKCYTYNKLTNNFKL